MMRRINHQELGTETNSACNGVHIGHMPFIQPQSRDCRTEQAPTDFNQVPSSRPIMRYETDEDDESITSPQLSVQSPVSTFEYTNEGELLVCPQKFQIGHLHSRADPFMNSPPLLTGVESKQKGELSLNRASSKRPNMSFKCEHEDDYATSPQKLARCPQMKHRYGNDNVPVRRFELTRKRPLRRLDVDGVDEDPISAQALKRVKKAHRSNHRVGQIPRYTSQVRFSAADKFHIRGPGDPDWEYWDMRRRYAAAWLIKVNSTKDWTCNNRGRVDSTLNSEDLQDRQVQNENSTHHARQEIKIDAPESLIEGNKNRLEDQPKKDNILQMVHDRRKSPMNQLPTYQQKQMRRPHTLQKSVCFKTQSRRVTFERDAAPNTSFAEELVPTFNDSQPKAEGPVDAFIDLPSDEQKSAGFSADSEKVTFQTGTEANWISIERMVPTFEVQSEDETSKGNGRKYKIVANIAQPEP